MWSQRYEQLIITNDSNCKFVNVYQMQKSPLNHVDPSADEGEMS